MNFSTKQKQAHRHRKQIHGYHRERGWEKGKLWVWDQQIHTAVHTIDKQGSAAQRRELYSVSRNNLWWKRIWKKYVCVCVCVCVLVHSHFAVHQKLTQHCKSTVFPFLNRVGMERNMHLLLTPLDLEKHPPLTRYIHNPLPSSAVQPQPPASSLRASNSDTLWIFICCSSGGNLLC